MPHAYCLEGRVLKKVRRLASRDKLLSSEWFRLKNGVSVSDVADMIAAEAVAVRKAARWRVAWPSYGRITVYNSGWSPDGFGEAQKFEIDG